MRPEAFLSFGTMLDPAKNANAGSVERLPYMLSHRAIRFAATKLLEAKGYEDFEARLGELLEDSDFHKRIRELGASMPFAAIQMAATASLPPEHLVRAAGQENLGRLVIATKLIATTCQAIMRAILQAISQVSSVVPSAEPSQGDARKVACDESSADPLAYLADPNCPVVVKRSLLNSQMGTACGLTLLACGDKDVPGWLRRELTDKWIAGLRASLAMFMALPTLQKMEVPEELLPMDLRWNFESVMQTHLDAAAESTRILTEARALNAEGYPSSSSDDE